MYGAISWLQHTFNTITNLSNMTLLLIPYYQQQTFSINNVYKNTYRPFISVYISYDSGGPSFVGFSVMSTDQHGFWPAG